jgi:L-seryl-tRNA(Ser) seleniumtransferase
MVISEARSLIELSLQHVINVTGVILHTNLGRAPLSTEALLAMAQVSQGYCNLEFDLQSGARGSRDVHVEQLLCQITGAEAADSERRKN